MQQQRTGSAPPGIEPETARPYTSNDTEQSDTLCAVHDWAILVMELFSSDAERYVRNFYKLLHCDNLDIETD